mgnify:CR=1 FL=1
MTMTSKIFRQMSVGLFLVVLSVFGTGCVGTLSHTKDGKTLVQLCKPSVVAGRKGHLYTRCAVDSKETKDTKSIIASTKTKSFLKGQRP